MPTHKNIPTSLLRKNKKNPPATKPSNNTKTQKGKGAKKTIAAYHAKTQPL
jgi:hypothetical protein